MNDLQNMTYEQAYARLEAILENMNAGKLSLEQSLNLFEEADKLITFCNQKLSSAEQKIETLIKNRDADIALSSSGAPLTDAFVPASNAALQKDMGI